MATTLPRARAVSSRAVRGMAGPHARLSDNTETFAVVSLSIPAGP